MGSLLSSSYCLYYKFRKMEVYLHSGRRSVSAVPPVRKRKMENTEHRSVSAVPPVWTRKMEVDSVLRFLHHRRVSAGQNNPDHPKKGISTESMSLEEYAQKDIRERKEKEM